MARLKPNVIILILMCLISLILISLFFLSSHPTKVITHLFVDRSRSNVESEKKRLVSQEICKYIVPNQEDVDELTVIEFDSDADSSQERLINSSDDLRISFISNVCKNLATKASKYSVPGTDIIPAFERYIKIINARKTQKIKQDSQNSKDIYISIFSIDALEGGQYDSRNPRANEFKTLVKNFLESGNFLVIFIGDETDRDKLIRFLKDIKDQYTENIYIEDVDKKKFKKKILDVYSKART